MTYKTFNKDTDTLEVGTKIRLGGREGYIKQYIDEDNITVDWGDSSQNTLSLHLFTFEIAVSPLTIDKRVKENIISICNDIPTMYADVIYAYLNSLEET